MMVVPNYVGPSSIEGVGVFAAEHITAGTAIWMLDERFDRLFLPGDIAAMDQLHRDYVERYGYPHMERPGITVVEFDHGKFMNHSESPNTDFTDPNVGWAIRDIAAGEEMTCDYREFDPQFVMLPGRVFVAPSEMSDTRPGLSLE